MNPDTLRKRIDELVKDRGICVGDARTLLPFAAAWEEQLALEAKVSAARGNEAIALRKRLEAAEVATVAKQNIIKSIQRTVNDHLGAEFALAGKDEGPKGG